MKICTTCITAEARHAGNFLVSSQNFLSRAGLLITYTIMLGDVLVGKAPEYNGFITNLANIHSGDLWYLDRRFVVSTFDPLCTFSSGHPAAKHLYAVIS